MKYNLNTFIYMRLIEIDIYLEFQLLVGDPDIHQNDLLAVFIEVMPLPIFFLILVKIILSLIYLILL